MFSEDQERIINHHLLGRQGDQLIRYMALKSLAGDTSNIPDDVVEIASGLGWTTTPAAGFTESGRLAADACREYLFWVERDRTLPFEGAAPHLTASYFRDKSILEIGSGSGANLMSLANSGAQVSGVEPMDSYIQMGRILSEKEGISPPVVWVGSAEVLPEQTQVIDLVLCVSAHQYFDIPVAIESLANLLPRGGELVLVGGTLRSFINDGFKEFLERPESAKSYVMTIINTLGYMLTGRRVLVGKTSFSTSRPIYPTRASLHRTMKKAGLVLKSPYIRVGSETCFHYMRN